MGERRGEYRVLLGETRGERDHWGDPDVDWRIIFTWIFRSGMWGYGLD
jgi:hypothetical protein